jgi:ATP-binding cassette subfamily B protein
VTAAAAHIRPPAERGPEAPATDLTLLGRLAPYARGHRRLFVLALVLVPVTTVASLAQPALVREALVAAVSLRSEAALAQVVLGFAAAIGVEFFARIVQTWALQLAGQRTIAALRRATYERALRLPLSYLDRTPIGRVTTRVTNDSDSLGELFASGAILAVADVVMLIGIVIAMFVFDPLMAAVAILVLPPLAFTVDRLRRGARESFRSIRGAIAQLNAYVAEQVQGMMVVQALSREQACQAEHAELNAAHRDANLRSIHYDALLYSVVESASAVTIALVVFVAARQVSSMSTAELALRVGTVVAFFDYVQRFFVPIRDLSQKWTIVQSSLAAAERVFGLLDVPGDDAPAPERPGAPVPGAHELELDSVSFAYRPGHDVLHGVSLSVPRGEKLAIVGATGSGKTTVTALALRLYDVERGQVRVEGLDVRAWRKEDLRARFAVVSQDVFLFSGTVAENVSGFEASPDLGKVTRVLDEVGLGDVIAGRGGLSARIGERGADLSAGQRQLLALARALYLDRPILILDEATANVDSETEAQIGKAIDRVLEGRTAIVIAHRLSTIRRADRIAVLHKGRLVEEGSHDALIQKGGLYAKLHEIQFARSA